MTTRKQALKAWGELALYVLAPFSKIQDITVPTHDKSELVDMLNIIKFDINEHEKLEEENKALKLKHAKVTELLGLYQTYHYEPSEINQLIKTLEKELGDLK